MTNAIRGSFEISYKRVKTRSKEHLLKVKKRCFSYLLPDDRGGRLKHCSLDWNLKQSFQARAVGSQLQLIVLEMQQRSLHCFGCKQCVQAKHVKQ